MSQIASSNNSNHRIGEHKPMIGKPEKFSPPGGRRDKNNAKSQGAAGSTNSEPDVDSDGDASADEG